MLAQSQNEYFNAMHEINAQWKYYPEHCPTESVHFKTDRDAIQAHLFLVCEALIKQTPKDLSTEQRNNRLQLIATLRDYAQEKIFPTNLYHSVRTPYFVDDFGVHCAVGYLMHRSGYDDLVKEIRQNENYKYIEEIKTKGVNEWAEKHGFTLDELKWIQPAYGSQPNYLTQVGQGTNGTIVKIVPYALDGLIVAGNFDTLDIIPCSNIGLYQDNIFTCLGGGLSGEITNVHVNSSQVFVFGALEHEDLIYPMAIWNNNTWEFIEIPSRQGAKATAGIAQQGYQIAITNPNDESKQEIWNKANVNSSWVKEVEINGFVTCIAQGQFGTGQVFAGAFDEFYTFDNQGEPVDTLSTKNVVFKKNNINPVWEPIVGNLISDTVRCIYLLNSQIFFGGTAINSNTNSSGILLTRYLNNTLQPLIMSSFFMNDTVSINVISAENFTNSLLIGGDFHYLPGFSAPKRHLGSYNMFFNSIEMLANLNAPVNCLTPINQNLAFIGGAFTKELHFNNDFRHLARFDRSLNSEQHYQPAINAFPNPFSDKITVDGLPSMCPYKIVDIQGRTIQSGNLKNNEAIDLENLNSGTYLLHIEYEDGMMSMPIVKQ